MSGEDGESNAGNGKGRGAWRIALMAAAAVAVIVAGGAGLAFLFPQAQPASSTPAFPTLSALLHPATPTPSAVIPTFALPTQTGIPQPVATPTFAGTLPDLSSIAGAWCIPKVPAQSGVVVEVVDGDTVRVQMDADGSLQTVRYAGVEAPPLDPPGQFMALEASALNAQLVEGQRLVLVRDVTDADKDGQLPRYALAGQTFVNLELVLEGAARAQASPPDNACFLTFQQAEQQATTAGRGLWSKTGQFMGFPTPALKTGLAECNCKGRDLDCRDFNTHAEAQGCFWNCLLAGYGDVFHLDNDGNGRVCGGLP